MQYLKLLLCSLILITMILGCSSGKNEAEVKPLTTEIKGDLGNFFECVEGTYKVVKSNQTMYSWEITFKLRKNETSNLSIPLIQSLENKSIELDFKLTLTDETGKPISGLKDFWMADGLLNNGQELDKLKALLKERNGSEEWLTLTTDVDYNSDYKEKLADGISKFIIRTNTKQSQIEPQSNHSSILDNPYDDELNEDISVSSDCNTELVEFEQFVDEYIKFAEKASEGDYSVMADAPSIMKKAESAGKKIQNMGQAKFGSTCWDKYLSIQQKLSEAALRMTKNLPKNMNKMQKQLDDLQNLIPN